MNNARLQLPNSFNFKMHRVPLSQPLSMIENTQVGSPTLHAIGGMTPLETMVCHVAGGMPEQTPQEVVDRAKDLLDECARVQGGKV